MKENETATKNERIKETNKRKQDYGERGGNEK